MKNKGWSAVSLVAVVGLCVGLLAAPAAGQQEPPRRPVRTAPKPQTVPTPAPQPAQPAAPAATPAQAQPKKAEPPVVGPYVRQENPKDLTLQVVVRVNLNSPNNKTTYRDPFSGRTVEMPVPTPMKFRTLGFIWPVVPSTASSDLFFNEIVGTLRVNDKVVDTSPEILEGYPGPVKLTRWDAGTPDTESEARQVQLDINIGMRCYNTVFDEAAAMKVPWPKSYPADVAADLQPQLYVEMGLDAAGQVRPYDDKELSDELGRWLQEEGIKDIKSVPPAHLAKMIAGKVWGSIQISGDGLTMMRTGELSGMEIMPPAMTLMDKRGSEQDVTALMAALYRKAGLPARTVIGWDNSGKDSKFLQKPNRDKRLRSWVEFALFDEANNTINWVPVDVARMRKVTNRPTSMDRPWPYFGTHDELNTVTPFALQFHPPTDVVAYGQPGFWGWFVTPAPAKSADQALKFVSVVSSRKGGSPRVDPKDPESNKPPQKQPVKKSGY